MIPLTVSCAQFNKGENMVTNWKRDYELKKLREGIDALEAYILKYEQIAQSSVGGKIMPIMDYPMGRVMASVQSYKNPQEARIKIKELYDLSLTLKDGNALAIKNNIKLQQDALAYLTAIGMPQKKKHTTYSRGRSKTTEVHCEWASEVRSFIPTYDGWDSVESTYKEKLAQVDKWEVDLKKIKDDEIRHQEIKREDAKKLRVIALLSAKYSLPIEASSGDIMDAILAKNKYLRLAHYLEMNRGDWNDGYSYAESGLDGFSIETPVDKEINDEIQGLITNWDCDGRVFRDCHWNYDEIFTLVKDEELMRDYSSVKQAYMDERY